MRTIKLALADGQQIFLEGLEALIQTYNHSRLDVVYKTRKGNDLLHSLSKLDEVNVFILGLNLKDIDAIDFIETLHNRISSRQKILVFSQYDHAKLIKKVFKAGANGYILKYESIHGVVTALESVLNGELYHGTGVSLATPVKTKSNGSNGSLFKDRFLKRHSLTKREIEILYLIAQAMSNKQIAEQLYISDQTVSVHRKNIMRKLGVSNTAGLIKEAYDNFIYT